MVRHIILKAGTTTTTNEDPVAYDSWMELHDTNVAVWYGEISGKQAEGLWGVMVPCWIFRMLSIMTIKSIRKDEARVIHWTPGDQTGTGRLMRGRWTAGGEVGNVIQYCPLCKWVFLPGFKTPIAFTAINTNGKSRAVMMTNALKNPENYSPSWVALKGLNLVINNLNCVADNLKKKKYLYIFFKKIWIRKEKILKH